MKCAFKNKNGELCEYGVDANIHGPCEPGTRAMRGAICIHCGGKRQDRTCHDFIAMPSTDAEWQAAMSRAYVKGWTEGYDNAKDEDGRYGREHNGCCGEDNR